MKQILVLSFLINILDLTRSAKILAIFPMPSISHQIVFQSLLNGLLERGHEIVYLTPNPQYPKNQTPNNLTEIDVHDISYNMWKYHMQNVKGNDLDQGESVLAIFKIASKIFEEQLKQPEVKNILSKNEKFDLIFVEQWIKPALAFSYKFKTPVIAMNSFGGIHNVFETFGAEAHPFIYPLCIHKRTYNLTFLEKVFNLYEDYYLDRELYNLEKEQHKMLKKYFGANVPSITELEDNINMLFLNIPLIWDENRPVPPNVIYLGGLHQRPQKELPQDLKIYLDTSKNGVIYISFGSNVSPSLLLPQKIQLILKVLSELPYNVLWRWDTDKPPSEYSSIKFSKWFPQSDLLKHPNIKLFITQAGLQSTDESIAAGVPVLGFPIFADQFHNAEKYEHHQIGIKLALDTVTDDEFRRAVITVIEDESYRQNIIKLRDIMYDHPQTSLEKAIWWSEYVIRHKGAKHLRAPTFRMSRLEYYETKLFFVILFIIVLFLLLLVVVVRYLNRVVAKVKIN